MNFATWPRLLRAEARKGESMTKEKSMASEKSMSNSYSKGTALITGSSTHLRRRDQRPVADDHRRLRRKAPGGFRRNRETTTHE